MPKSLHFSPSSSVGKTIYDKAYKLTVDGKHNQSYVYTSLYFRQTKPYVQKIIRALQSNKPLPNPPKDYPEDLAHHIVIMVEEEFHKALKDVALQIVQISNHMGYKDVLKILQTKPE